MKKKFRIPVILFLTILSGMLMYHQKTRDNRIFHRLMTDYFKASLEEDTLSLHYILADSSAYFKKEYKAALPVYSTENQQQHTLRVQTLLSNLHIISPEKLNVRNQHTYRLLIPWLENELAGSQYLYYQEPLSPTSGIHTELPILLAEYTLRTQKDIIDYLNILESIPAYLDSLATYEQEKAAADLFMPAIDAALVRKQCDAILDPVQLQNNTHFLQTTFSERLDELVQKGIVSDSEKDRFLAENNRLLETVVLPAYSKLADSLFLLSDEQIRPSGLCNENNGTSYYLHLLQKNTGSSKTPSEIQELLLQDLQKSRTVLQGLLLQYQAVTHNKSLSFPLQHAEQMLCDLQTRILADFPSLPTQVSCVVKTIDSTLESYTSPAFYLIPPVDKTEENTIYINPASTLPGLDLYTTLAHEGYPGHLYQTVYRQSKHPIESLLHFGGFTEGWAYYAENLSYQYATDLLKESGASKAECLIPEIIRTERNLQLALYCLADLSIHLSDASAEAVKQFFSDFGITNPENAEDIYHYIRREPTTYLKYYLGYLEILELQSLAKELWKDNYTNLSFHRFLLENGPLDFETLRHCLKQVKPPKECTYPLSFRGFPKQIIFSVFLQNNQSDYLTTFEAPLFPVNPVSA